jgi:transposase-like protein
MDVKRAPRDCNNPGRSKSSESDYSLMEFMRMFPDDAVCLDQLWRDRFAPDGHHAHCPKCERERKFHRTKTRASYTCDTCGLHVHPQKGTIFERSSTSLRLWFYAMFLMASTRCGISAKQMERELGVTYKQAHKMMKRIRTLMGDDGEPLSGDVEIDETSWGGKPCKPHGQHAYLAAGRAGKVSAPPTPTKQAALHRPPGGQPLGWRACAGRRLHEHDRGRVRKHEDWDARGKRPEA